MIVCIILYIKSQLEKSAMHSSPPFIDGWCWYELSWWSKNLIIHCALISFTTESRKSTPSLQSYWHTIHWTCPWGNPWLACWRSIQWPEPVGCVGKHSHNMNIILFQQGQYSLCALSFKYIKNGQCWLLGDKLKSFLFCRHREEKPFRCILPLCPRSPNG